MREMMVITAVTGGTLVGSFSDPLFLVMLAIAGGLGVKVRSPWLVLVFAGICVVVRQVVAANNRELLGLGPSPFPYALPAATIIGILLIWCVVRFVVSLMAKPS